MNKPVAGEDITFRCAVVILGGRKPPEDDRNSRMEDASGVMEVLLIPTWLKLLPIEINNKDMVIKNLPTSNFCISGHNKYLKMQCCKIGSFIRPN